MSRSETRRPGRRVAGTIVGIVAVGLFAVAAVNAASSGSGASPRTNLSIIAPAAPGGGWDGFGREAQRVMRDDDIAGGIQVKNIPGASGTIGLGALAEMGDRHDVMMVTGGVMVGGILINSSAVDLEDVTPIARLADDFNVLVVPGDSPYDTLEEFADALAADPGGTAIAGGSLGGIDHLLAGMLAQEVDIDPSTVNYLAYPGGGEVVTSMLSHTAEAGLSGYNEFRDQIESGNLKALAVSAPEPIDGIDVPTFVEQGYDVAMSNWRGFVAPPDISDEVRNELTAMVTEMHDSSGWTDALERNDWVDSFMVGDEFAAFIREETERTEAIVKELGL
ncbi:Bug family tripartite tricarboxylate transporter substrate binding protein [Microbacterium dauci]|uniref:Tripartite tricarboxylate transporter substrate-binding protein n=1 Tax=Microbacterium dauci TaxID=3048008 RepID=A0ABT6ZH26_9MICO|nr:tripartite tricarboxylate transporter substrate-binding protein [Microbacterium sp. LX3-4]MDJ1115452.1 tripartite tricarboxylate transporter substrate-binding protein [Microbacterium sp. LX3-4]